MAKLVPSAENSIFALDIGTRTVIGVVALVESGSLRIVAQHIMEHDSRAMFDGQIHDIPKVADTVLELKRALEKKVGFTLEKAAIAAAGRSLITKTCRAEMEINDETEIDSVVVNSLEMTGIRDTSREIESIFSESNEKYYYIGHSVIKYYINNLPVTNLVGHRGRSIAADMIATFLPESVVNGLYSVLDRVGLEPLNMTLEPIAAIEVLIPESMRLLNLALIDIGAGTSDIAITKDGSVLSYGMVAMAGDKVTETLAGSLLTDFNWAEKVKRSVGAVAGITYKDALGVDNNIMPDKILELINPVLEQLAGEIAGNIIELNGGEAPKMVLCVGGGSRIPQLSEKLAEKLGLPPQNVASRGRVAVQNLIVDEEGLEGPEGVTVIGIATVALKKIGQQFIMVKVDGKEYSLFNTGKLNVSNALGLLDFNPRDLIGQNGKDLRFTLNGNPEVVYGGFTTSAEIYINGRIANLQSIIGDRDEIRLYKAGPGLDAKAFVSDYLGGSDKLKVFLNSKIRTVQPVCVLNGEPAEPESEIKEGDQLNIQNPTIEEFLHSENLTDQPDHIVLVNGAAVDPNYVLREKDKIVVKPREKILEEDLTNRGNAGSTATEESGARYAAGAAAGSETGIAGNPDPEAKVITVTVNGDKVELSGKKGYIFVDVFNYIAMDMAAVTKVPELTLNGAPTRFAEAIADGDVIGIVVE